jgi:putative tryptophan/tyrosine transport system substrate-binding protein
MRRRDFIATLGGAAAWPLTTRAQPMPVIGFLNSASPDGYAPMLTAFRQGLKDTGFVEGQNVGIEFRWAEGQYDRLPAMAADLVHREVAVIVANTPANVAAKNATTTIPIIFTTGNDPVQLGLVTSLNRPSSNVTGVSTLAVELAPKRLELAHELVPAASVIGVLVNPKNSAQAVVVTRDLQAAATKLGLQLSVQHASTESEIEDAFATLTQKRVSARASRGGYRTAALSAGAPSAWARSLPMLSSIAWPKSWASWLSDRFDERGWETECCRMAQVVRSSRLSNETISSSSCPGL